MATEMVDVIVDVDVEKEKERQRLEVEVLQSIYNDEEFSWYTDDNGWICIQFYAFLLLTKDFSITFHQDTCSDDGNSDSCKDGEEKEEEEAVTVKHLPPLELTAALPPDYPSKSSPQFSLSCSWLTADMLTRLCKQFDTIWEENRSSEILYTWTEFLKEDTLRFFSLDDNNNLVVNKSCLKNDYASLNKRQQAIIAKKTPAKVQQPTVKSVKSENNLNSVSTSQVGDNQNDKRSDSCSDDSTLTKDKNLSLEDESVNENIALVSGAEKDDGDKHVPASTDASTSSAPTINCTNGSSGGCSHKSNTNKMFQTRLFYNNYGNDRHQKFNKRFNRHQNYSDNYSHQFYNHNNNSHQKNYRKRNSYNNFNCDNNWSSSTTTVGTDKSCDDDDDDGGGGTQAVAAVHEEKLIDEKRNKQPVYKFNRHQNYSHFYNHNNNNSHQKNYRKRNSYNNFNCDNHWSSSTTTVGTDKSCDDGGGGGTQAVAAVHEEKLIDEKRNKQPVYKYRHYNGRRPHNHDNNYNTRNRKANKVYDKSNDVCFVGIADRDKVSDGHSNKPYENDSDVCIQPSMSTNDQSDVSKICDQLSVSTVSEDKKSENVNESDNGGNSLSELSSKSVTCGDDDNNKVASKQSVIMPDKNNCTVGEDACTLSQCVALLVNKNSGDKDKRVKKNVSQYSVNNLVNYLRSYNEERIVNEFNKSYYCCTICFQDKMGHLCTQFKPCGHVFCKLCIGQYVKVKIDERAVFVIKCPQDSCDSDITPSQVRDLVGPELFAKYDGILLTTTLETMTDITLCPRSACQYPVSQEPDEKMAVCPSCHYVFCVYCKMVYHGIEPCRFRSDEKAALVKQYLEGDEQVKRLMEQRYGRKQLNTLIEASLSETWISNNSHDCPHCNASIEKSGGCNKMVCWRCSTFFCWVCQARLDPSNPYKHYSDPVSRCHNQLFEGIPDDDEDDENGFIFYEEVGEDDYLIDEYGDENFIIDDELAAI